VNFRYILKFEILGCDSERLSVVVTGVPESDTQNNLPEGIVMWPSANNYSENSFYDLAVSTGCSLEMPKHLKFGSYLFDMK
jgi:hypothetical protein